MTMHLLRTFSQNVFLKLAEKRKEAQCTYLNIYKNYLFKVRYNEFINAYKRKRSTMILEHKYSKGSGKKQLICIVSILLRPIMAPNNQKSWKPPRNATKFFVLSKKEGLYQPSEISEIPKCFQKKTVWAQITKHFGILREKIGEKIWYAIIYFFLLEN